ncbi:MAG: mechanosensitive ion channel [Gammaproteobacteria bacterium]|nr:mechanosensitive ion channel [Gammaproteobacteria bacterium]
MKLAVFIFVAFWISKVARLAMHRVLNRRNAQTATIYTLDRLVNYTIITLGVFVGLSAVGVDFTTFAVLAGALGVGIGFGLQPLVANFVSGIILLLDRSIKITDYIELESGVMGQVKTINMRTTMITTNDNVDILIPNSEFTTGRVVNWTLGEEATRLHISFGVAYGSDKDVVKTAALEAAERVPAEMAYLPDRKPQIWFVEFGDSSLNFELLVWLGPHNVRRPSAVRAAYLWEIHSALERYHIEVPFPQRDLHLKSVLGMSKEELQALLPRAQSV